MKTMRALLWLDWRLVRWEWLSLLLLCTVMPVIARYAAHEEVAEGILVLFGLPVSGALLGATIASAEHSPEFLRSRATPWPWIVGLRVAQRCLLALALVALSRGVLAMVSDAESVLGPGGEVWPMLTALGATGIAGAFLRHPIAALPVGLVGFLIVTAPLGYILNRPGLVLAVDPATAALAVAGAWFVAALRGGGLRMQWGRFLLRLGVTTVTLGLVGLIVAELVVRSEIRRANEAWSWYAERELDLPSVDELDEAMAVLTAARLVDETAREGWRWLPKNEQARWFRETVDRLWIEQRAAPVSNIGFLPAEQLERGLAGSRANIAHAAGALSQHEDLQAITTALGNASLASFLTLLIADATLSQERGQPELATQTLDLAGRLLTARARTGWWGHLDRSQFLYYEYRRAHAHRGVALKLSTTREFAELDLREGILARHRATWRSYEQSFGSNPMTLVWRHKLAREHADSGRVLGELMASGNCDRPELLRRIESDSTMGSRNFWTPAVSTELWADLDYLVAARRAGLDVELEPVCAGTRWVTETRPDGSWTIHLKGGEEWHRHDEPAAADIQRE